jgi:hypothetical protein
MVSARSAGGAAVQVAHAGGTLSKKEELVVLLLPNLAVGGLTMMNRRQFVCAAAGAAVLAHNPNARAATYDLVIKSGRVIDPSLGINMIGDVAIADGRIAAVKPAIAPVGAAVLDARGKLVVPGLIDIRRRGRGKGVAEPAPAPDQHFPQGHPAGHDP